MRGSTGTALSTNRNEQIMMATDKAPLRRYETAGGSGSTKENKAKEPALKTPPCESPKIWVKKWVDYSSKYGLGYLLSNGAIGVFFNDSTKIVIETNG